MSCCDRREKRKQQKMRTRSRCQTNMSHFSLQTVIHRFSIFPPQSRGNNVASWSQSNMSKHQHGGSAAAAAALRKVRL